MTEKIVVLLKTHVWNEDIEKFAMKIRTETYPHGIDFFILMHNNDDQPYDKIKNDQIKSFVLKFTEAEIKSIYPVGFYSMWMSNHWILMWFYRQYASQYKYFWSVEYDVRIVGNSSKIWKYQSSYDFLYPLGNYRHAGHIYNDCYVGGKLTTLGKFRGYLQIARYSDQALEYLNKCYEEGENGQDELITFSLLNRGQLTGSQKFLQSLIRGKWSWENKYSEQNKIIYEKLNILEKSSRKGNVFILHPIK